MACLSKINIKTNNTFGNGVLFIIGSLNYVFQRHAQSGDIHFQRIFPSKITLNKNFTNACIYRGGGEMKILIFWGYDKRNKQTLFALNFYYFSLLTAKASLDQVR